MSVESRSTRPAGMPSSALVAFIGGMVMERFRPERWVEDYV